jgi:WD40 repeat protein
VNAKLLFVAWAVTAVVGTPMALGIAQTLPGARQPRHHCIIITSPAFSGDTVSRDETAQHWDALVPTLQGQELTKEIATLKTGYIIFSVAFSPNGKMLTASCAGRRYGTVMLWDVQTRKDLNKFEDRRASGDTVCFSPDGKTLASSDMDGLIQLWDIPSGKDKTSLKGERDKPLTGTVCFSPDGEILTSGLNDGTIKLWDPSTGRSRAILKGHKEPVTSVAFSPNGKMLATSNWDQSIKLWEMASYKEASSHKSVGQLRDREFSKLMIQQDFHHAETA